MACFCFIFFQHRSMHQDRGRHAGETRYISTLRELTRVPLQLRKTATPSVLLPSRLEEARVKGRWKRVPEKPERQGSPERIRSIEDSDLRGQIPDWGPAVTACGRVPAESHPKPESPSPGLYQAMKGRQGKEEG